MKIFRIEHEESRRGVYSDDKGSSIVFDWCYENGMEPSNPHHPAPRKDSKLVSELMDCGGIDISNYWCAYDFKFGFASIDQFRAWFFSDEVLIKLKENGFKLYIIEAKEGYAGNCQAVFNSKKPYKVIETRELI